MSLKFTSSQANSDVNSVVFVDSNVSQADSLIEGIQANRVFLLNDESSGVDQITDILSQYTDLDSVHIYSHGSAGSLQLGNRAFSSTTLGTYQGDVASWGDAIDEYGDLLFYGCNLAGNEDGLLFVDQVSELTGADVAASEDKTGHISLGGDWNLEVTTGEIAKVLAVEAYGGILMDDTQAPSATLTAVNLSVAGNQPYEFTVTYDDPSGIDPSTLDSSDIQVTGPNGYRQFASLVSIDNAANGSPRTATYSIVAPGGDWDEGDNGTYTVRLRRNQVSDTLGNAANRNKRLGTFGVNITDGTGRFTYNGNTYQLTTAGSWDAAQAEAVAAGGNLVTINDAAEETWLRNTFGNVESFWTGLNDTVTEGQYAWVSGESVTYTNWGPGEPDGGTAENVVVLNGNSQGEWDDISAAITNRGILEIGSGGSNDTEAPTASLSADALATAGNAPYEFTVTYSDDSGIDVSTLDNSDIRVTGPNGYRQTASLVSIDVAGNGSPRTATYSVTAPGGDWETGDNGTYTVKLRRNQVADTVGNQSSRTKTLGSFSVAINDEPSSFALQDSSTLFVNEAAGVATVTAVRTGGTSSAATVEYTLNELGTADSATAEEDFITPTFDGRPNTGQIVFAPEETEVSFTIAIEDDALVEGNETFAVGLQNPSAGSLGTPRTQLITIVDNDSLPTIALSQAAVTVSESSSAASITVQRSGNAGIAAAVDYTVNNGSATSGQDFSGATAGTVNFAPGETTKTIAISIADDDLTEGTEDFTVTLNNAVDASLGAQTTTTVTILDNDLNVGDLTRTTAVSGFIQPTTLDWTSDGQYMLVAEKRGVVKVVDNGVLQSTPLIDISGEVNGTRDRGLLGLAIHPDFPSQPYVYLLYTYDPPETANFTGLGGADGRGNRPSRMIRVTVDPTTMVADPNSTVVLTGTNSTWDYTSEPTRNSTGDNSILPSGIVNGTTVIAPPSEIEAGSQDNDPNRPGIQNLNVRDYLATDSESHTIGDLEFGEDGYLYLSNGDGTSYNFVDPRTVRVQDINNLSGKVLRIDPITGAGVASNPFYNGDGNSNQSKVFYSGVRNPFRLAMDPLTNLPVIGDVGWNSWEEVNTGPAGSNFGWPYLEGPNPTGGYQSLAQAIAFYNNGNRNNPEDEAAVLPILPRRHGAPDNANAIVVGDFYNDDTLIFGDVNSGTLYAATLTNDRQVTEIQVFDSSLPAIVDMKMGPDGKLYGVNIGSGSIVRWDPQ